MCGALCDLLVAYPINTSVSTTWAAVLSFGNVMLLLLFHRKGIAVNRRRLTKRRRLASRPSPVRYHGVCFDPMYCCPWYMPPPPPSCPNNALLRAGVVWTARTPCGAQELCSLAV